MWRDMAYTQIGISKLPELTEDCVIDITLTPPHKPRRRRDVDNYSKALLDALVHMRVLKDDHIIQELTTRWDRNGDEPGASIKIFTKEKSHQEFYS